MNEKRLDVIRKLYEELVLARSQLNEGSNEIINAIEKLRVVLLEDVYVSIVYPPKKSKMPEPQPEPEPEETVESADPEKTVRKKHVKPDLTVLRKLVGTMSDADTASKLGCSIQTVYKYRRQWGVKPITPSKIATPIRKPWTKVEEDLLGTKSDAVVAQILRRTVASVRQRRMRQNIPLYKTSVKLLQEHRHLHGSFSNKELAELLGIPKQVVDAILDNKKTIDDIMK